MTKPHVDQVEANLFDRVKNLYTSFPTAQKSMLLNVGFALPHHHFFMAPDEILSFEFNEDVIKAAVVKNTSETSNVCMWYPLGDEWIPAGVTDNPAHSIPKPFFPTTYLSGDLGVCTTAFLCKSGYHEQTDEVKRVQLFHRNTGDQSFGDGILIDTMLGIAADGPNTCYSSTTTTCSASSDWPYVHSSSSTTYHSSS